MSILPDQTVVADIADHELRLLERLAQASQPLWGHRDVDELLAGAAEVGRRILGFDRALVLSRGDGELHARDCGPLADPASDRLRRQVLGAPISEDAAARTLELGAHLLVPITIEGRAVGVLLLDRVEPAIQVGEHEVARHHATVIGLLLERLLLRTRVANVAAELRRITAFSNALMRESVEASLSLPSSRDAAVVPFPGLGTGECEPPPAREFDGFGLTVQESRVAALLAAGHSNRQIAAELVVSPDTVKSHVAHVLAKLGVANRAQAAVLLAQAG